MRQFGTGSRIAAVGALLGLCLWCGCRSSGIDPSGRRIFADTPSQAAAPGSPTYYEYPGSSLPWDSVQIIVNPSRCVAPIGSDVVLLAGVLGPDNYLRMNQRVEWILSPESAGEFLEFDRGTNVDLMFGDFNWPRKKSNHWVITSTSRQRLELNRETPTPTDDVCVARGQTWVTISSPVEGTSYVTAYAPSVYGWDVQKQTATVYWVDADWQFPPPAVASAGGRHLFTTTVTRHSDKSPRAGWLVRYEITGGPPAGFAPSGAQSVEVPTNEAGQACAEILQSPPSAGTNQIAVSVVRPAMNAATGPLVMQSGSTSIAWSAPQLAIRKTGPAVGAVNATLVYQIVVTNTGDVPAEDVRVVDDVPSGLSLISSNPPAESLGGQLQWLLGRLSPQQSRTFEVQLRALRNGTMTSCAEATASGGLRAEHCTTTTIGSPQLAVRIEGPASAAGTVGDEVTYTIIIENQGDVTATGLVIKDEFDPGLEFTGGVSPIQKNLPDLPPEGPDLRPAVTFRLTRPGVLNQYVEVTGNGGVRATARATITVSPAAGGFGGTAPTGRPAITVNKSGPLTANVGQMAQFSIVVQNTGEMPLTNVKVVDSYDRQLRPIDATTGHTARNGQLTWTIQSLPIGQIERYTVQCQCDEAVAETINGVTVTSAEGIEARDDARMQILAQPASTNLPTGPTNDQTRPLLMNIHSFANSVNVGTIATYEVTITNPSMTDDEDLALSVDFPAGMQPVEGYIKGAQEVGHSIVGQTVQFQPVRVLRRGGELRYTIGARGTTPGTMTVVARLRSKQTPREIVSEEETIILGPR